MGHDEHVKKELLPPLTDPNALLSQRVAAFRELYPNYPAVTDRMLEHVLRAVDHDLVAEPSILQDHQDPTLFGPFVMSKVMEWMSKEEDTQPPSKAVSPPPFPATTPRPTAPSSGPPPLPETIATAPTPTPADPPRPVPTPSSHPLITPPTNNVVITEIAPTPPASSPQDETLGEDDGVAPTRREPSLAVPANLHTAQPPPATPKRTTADQSAPTPPRTSTTRPTTARGGGGDKGWIFALICLVIGLVTAGTCVRDYYKTTPTAAVPTAATPSVASSAAAPPTAAPSATALAPATTTATAAPSSLPAGWIKLPRRGRTCPQDAPRVKELPLDQRKAFFDSDVDANKMTASKKAWDDNPTRQKHDLVRCHSFPNADGSQDLADCQICLE